MCTNTSIYLVVEERFLSVVGFYIGVSGYNCQWSQIVMWFGVTAAGVVTEAIMWPLSSQRAS